MARRGFGSTALRAALGAATGIGEGLQQREVLAEQKRQRTLLEERQRAQDEAALREEERQLVDSGFISADRLSSMSMPGATPLPSMEPTVRQKVGGKEYVYVPSIAQAEKHRGDVMAKSLARAERMRDRAEADKQLDADITAARKGGRFSDAAIRLRATNKGAFEGLYPEPNQESQLTAYQRLQEKRNMDEAEAIFNTTGLDPAQAAAISSAFKSLRKAYPTRPARELIYMAVQGAASVPKTPTPKGGGRFGAPPGSTPPAAAKAKPSFAQPPAPVKDEFDMAAENRGD